MSELFIENGKLAPREVWIERIEQIKTEVSKFANPLSGRSNSSNELMENNESKAAKLKQAIINAIKTRIPKDKKCALLLSGGVDSSLIAWELKKQGADIHCYTVGIDKSEDMVMAKKLTKLLNLKHTTHELTLDEVEHIFKTIAPWYLNDERLKDENLAVLFGVAAVEYAAVQLVKKDNINVVFGGLGSEEIFAGYLRHEKATDVNEECWRGLQQMWQRDLIRDCILASHFGIDVKTPFLDGEVIKAAMRIPGNQKIKGDIKKYVLRVIAEQEGLPNEFAFRKKMGAQYGSKFDTAINKLAKKNGFKFKKDYLTSFSRV